MTTSTLRQRLASGLFAAALLPLAVSVHAAPGSQPGGQNAGQMPDALKARMEERRQAVYEDAGIDAATQEELNAAQQEHYEAMQSLRQEYRARMQEILTDEQQEALNQAMRNMQRQQMKQAPGRSANE
ncbi:hypothetical protein [Vreelandella jeotgali]|uniref:hypothetical protein n=1 Tax=Vreelandella jeotgali TaxID=553386 RepID=UPI00034AC739|nr:hypothetical protein [Halomonas jeotgali]